MWSASQVDSPSYKAQIIPILVAFPSTNLLSEYFWNNCDGAHGVVAEVEKYHPCYSNFENQFESVFVDVWKCKLEVCLRVSPKFLF